MRLEESLWENLDRSQEVTIYSFPWADSPYLQRPANSPWSLEYEGVVLKRKKEKDLGVLLDGK